MIEGIKVRLTSDQLQQIVLKLSETHFKQGEESAAQALKLAQEETEGENTGKGFNNAVSSLSQAAKRHRKLSIYFTFLATHLIPGEIYVLDDVALERLEIAERRF